MKQRSIFIYGVIVSILSIFLWRVTQPTYFSDHSEKYLNGYRLDLPEELSTVVDNGDGGRKDTLIAYKDTVSKTIYIQFK